MEHRGVGKEDSARKLAASLWRSAVTTDCTGGVRWRSCLTNGLRFQFCPTPPSPKSSMEGVTKWDYINYFCVYTWSPETISIGQSVSFTDKKCINKAKIEGLQMRRVERSIKKLDEEVSSPRTAYHQNIHDHTVQDSIDDARRARNNCNKTHLFCAKLMHDFEKEKKVRELWEDVCIQQAEEIEANKVEIRELRNLCAGIQREAAEDRKMLKLAEAWREERAQMKLDNAKLILEDKYSQLRDLITDLNNFLPSSS